MFAPRDTFEIEPKPGSCPAITTYPPVRRQRLWVSVSVATMCSAIANDDVAPGGTYTQNARLGIQ